MVDSPAALDALVPQVRTASWVALDTEADSLHAYPEKLCLLQLSLPGTEVLVDPLAGLDLGPLLAALQPHELIMHGADYDMRLLYLTCGFTPTRLFDTMWAARFLGVKEFGLINLVHRFLGIQLEKGPQKANWAQRPLTPRMSTYALNDTRHLHPLAERLRHDLEACGRLEWHRQHCARFITEATCISPEDPDECWRVKGSSHLDRRALAVLRALWHWREREAVASNRPPFFVLMPEHMLAVAERASQSLPLDGALPRRFSPRRRDSLLHAVAEAQALTEAQWPHPRRPQPRRRTTGAERRRYDELQRRRDRRSAQLGLDPALIASRATLSLLAREGDQADVLPWQREVLFG